MRITFILFIVCISCSRKKDVTAQISLHEKQTTSENCLFPKIQLEVEIFNNTADTIFLPGLSEYISMDTWTNDNYGSWQAEIEARKSSLQEFLKNGKSGNAEDIFKVKIPDFENYLQQDSFGDTIDLAAEFRNLETIYHSQMFHCIEEEDYLPKPPFVDQEEKKMVIAPIEKLQIMYDITPFLLRNATYVFQFYYSPLPVKTKDGKNELLQPYKYELKSNSLEVSSQKLKF